MEINRETQELLSAINLSPQDLKEISTTFLNLPRGWRLFSAGDAPIYVVLADRFRSSDREKLNPREPSYLYVIQTETQLFLYLGRKDTEGLFVEVIPSNRGIILSTLREVFTGLNFSNKLKVTVTLNRLYGDLKDKLQAGQDFVNRGLFSTQYLKTRLLTNVKVQLDGKTVAEHVGNPERVLTHMGWGVKEVETQPYRILELRLRDRTLGACVISPRPDFDLIQEGKVAPSYVAISLLRSYEWVFVTDGVKWRLYYSRAPSSDNYFEISLRGAGGEDPRLQYFIRFFSPEVYQEVNGQRKLDQILVEGAKVGKAIQDQLRKKIMEGDLFLNLVRGVLDLDPLKEYSDEDLRQAKELATRLLFRLLFILYAESRGILPVERSSQPTKYSEISLHNLLGRLDGFESRGDGDEIWVELKKLFRVIRKGDPQYNVPGYDSELFDEGDLDRKVVRNKFLLPALRDLGFDGKERIDYAELGVRQIGDIYEGLLGLDVARAEEDSYIVDGRVVSAKALSDLKEKPTGMIRKGDVFLKPSPERKSAGAFYTPDEIVRFLVTKALEPHLREREEEFSRLMKEYRETPAKDLEERIENLVFGIRVLDPAMGSGHFLVRALEELTRWAIELVKRYPDSPLARRVKEAREMAVKTLRERGFDVDETLVNDYVMLRRMILKRCIYGVDINPMAVELAKLSLWLSSLSVGLPLNHLDNNLKAGNSLIGVLRREEGGTLDLFTFDQKKRSLREVRESLDLTLEEVEREKELDRKSRDDVQKMRYDVITASYMDERFEKISKLSDPTRISEEDKKRLERLVEDHMFFHWPLEFPDVMESGGFTVVVGNPPWDNVKPRDDDFFDTIIPGIRKLSSKTKKEPLYRKYLKDSKIREQYELYIAKREEEMRYFNPPNKKLKSTYRLHGGELNLWRLFLERMINLVAKEGTLGVVVPSILLNGAKSSSIREQLLKGKIEYLYDFKNELGIFPDIHKSYAFTLIIWRNSSKSQHIKVGFRLTDLSILSDPDISKEKDKILTIDRDIIEKFSPSLFIPRYSRNDARIMEKIINLPSLELLNIQFLNGFNKTLDRDLFRTDGKGWPLFEGKNFHQFLPYYEIPEFTFLPDDAIKRLSNTKLGSKVKEFLEKPKLCYREVASSTNVRTVIACILPPSTFYVHDVWSMYTTDLDLRWSLYLLGILDSLVFDFVARLFVEMNVTKEIMKNMRVPKPDFSSPLVYRLLKISAILSSPDDKFKQLTDLVGEKPRKISMKERIDLTAELNAIVAKLYGLTREELDYVIKTFKFEENPKLYQLDDPNQEIKWDDKLVRQFNGEVAKRVLSYFDNLEVH
ncbi:BREX-1 system adenine-specific DNA-methyltransferase PglX [Metallosphaera sedula]|uniref:BREX-1 system adenine-specific DNA-methyltransferase PglX n=1 Tax=Metallosphaera sedula TaxID=43687 RepID=UPI0020C02C19|nr:BREX-1 system adenine-specific DNA-methyltransferase PglX [Metallosphaera sedula]BBL47031.1 restriction endonuclease [Metallosphaera sedula]